MTTGESGYEMVHVAISSSAEGHKNGYGFQFDTYSTEQASAMKALLIDTLHALQQRLYVALPPEEEQALQQHLEEQIASLRLWFAETRAEGERRLLEAGHIALFSEENEGRDGPTA